jgi:hypothetical protein
MSDLNLILPWRYLQIIEWIYIHVSNVQKYWREGTPGPSRSAGRFKMLKGYIGCVSVWWRSYGCWKKWSTWTHEERGLRPSFIYRNGWSISLGHWLSILSPGIWLISVLSLCQQIPFNDAIKNVVGLLSPSRI